MYRNVEVGVFDEDFKACVSTGEAPEKTVHLWRVRIGNAYLSDRHYPAQQAVLHAYPEIHV